MKISFHISRSPWYSMYSIFQICCDITLWSTFFIMKHHCCTNGSKLILEEHSYIFLCTWGMRTAYFKTRYVVSGSILLQSNLYYGFPLQNLTFEWFFTIMNLYNVSLLIRMFLPSWINKIINSLQKSFEWLLAPWTSSMCLFN